MNQRRWLFLTLAIGCSGAFVAADDSWLQWGGSQRDFSVGDSILDRASGLEVKWKRELGEGYSAILAEGDKLYTMYREGDEEVVVCLSATDGETVWEQRYNAPFPEDGDASFGKGPNSTPLVLGDSLIAIGFNADVHCLDKKSGEVRWKTNLISDLEGTDVGFGYSASPLAWKDTIILPVGGEGRSLVALNASDGSLVWSAQDFQNSYSTPLLITVDGVDQIVLPMTDQVIAVNPENGKLLWEFPLLNQWSTHCFVPVWNPQDQTLFVSSFRQSHLLKLSRDGAGFQTETVWSDKRAGIGFTNAVRIGNVIYGSTGGQRSPSITAIDLSTGEMRWRERGFGLSNYVASGQRLLLMDSKGVFAIAEPDEEGLGAVVEKQVLNGPKAWTVPTLVERTVYARDQKEIVALQLKQPRGD